MNLYEHFSCLTKLPIRLKDVRQHLLDQQVAATIRYVPVNTMLTEFVRGFARRYRFRAGMGPPGIHAEIFYSTKLPPLLQRVVICKELTHLTEFHDATAVTRDQVSRLIREAAIPASLAISLPAKMDHVGLLHSLAILLPRDALHELRAPYAKGSITDDRIATLARLPEEFFPFLMSDEWKDIVEKIV